MTSWKTTLAGIFAILGTIAATGKLALAGDYAGAISAALAGLPVGVGLIFAKDHTATPAA